ncbi:MAG: hypothetical protein QXW97_01370 [Candidatus Pacearchaeota archaeon]
MKKKEVILIITVLIFSSILVYTPHYTYPFPVHIDEWHHITEAIKLKNQEYNLGWNSTEFGFHFILMIMSYFFDLVLFYKFLPVIWIILTSLILFIIVYKKTNNNFYISLFSIIFLASLKSNVNLLGIWFFTPLTFAIPFIFLYIYFYTEGIKKQNKKYIIISLIIMIFLIPVHAISLTFSIPFLTIYTLINYKFLKKQIKFFALFLIIPIIGLFFYSITFKISLIKSLFEIFNLLLFKHGWGVLELNNSLLEVYSFTGYLFAILGAVFIILIKEERKKHILYLIWPLTLTIMIIIFKIFDISFLSPYQRNLYYLAISLPFLSSLGLYYFIKLINKKIIEKIDAKEKSILFIKKITNILIIIIVFFFVFRAYYKIPENTLLYKLIDYNDYYALKYLLKYPKGVALSTPSISEAIYPISNKYIVSGIYFYNPERKEEVNNFFKKNQNCEYRNSLVKKYDVKYVISKNQSVNCNWSLIYNKTSINSSTFIYEIKE